MYRYHFFNIFGVNPQTQDVYPLYNTWINGQFYAQYVSIPRGNSFGGINIYQFIGRDFGGNFNTINNTLNLITVY